LSLLLCKYIIWYDNFCATLSNMIIVAFILHSHWLICQLQWYFLSIEISSLIISLYPRYSCHNHCINHSQTTTFSTGGTPEQILYLVNQGVVPPLCALLNVHDSKVIMMILGAVEFRWVIDCDCWCDTVDDDEYECECEYDDIDDEDDDDDDRDHESSHLSLNAHSMTTFRLSL